MIYANPNIMSYFDKDTRYRNKECWYLWGSAKTYSRIGARFGWIKGGGIVVY